ncbi:hypothetical protein Z946_3927 [Sulfitobacter noctilucicola]|nr:hypothetical protein Z946_3927 [Sulfitobacter noctilucicola]
MKTDLHHLDTPSCVNREVLEGGALILRYQLHYQSVFPPDRQDRRLNAVEA